MMMPTRRPWLTAARHSVSLLKTLQTLLLLVTGLAGFASARCPVVHWTTLVGLGGSLFLAIGGSTVLNMWYDRDVDALMPRTCHRPLPSGTVSPRQALTFGALLCAAGVSWALAMGAAYGLIVAAGVFFDLVVYTWWLKRRTAWSIVWGGVAGAMPVVAGRLLGLGRLDWIGVLLGLSILLWIPTHILTFAMRYDADYRRAHIPTIPSTYGFPMTRGLIALSGVLSGMAIVAAAVGIGMSWGYLRFLAALGVGLLVLAAIQLLRPSENRTFSLFKYASVYMFSSMLAIILWVV